MPNLLNDMFYDLSVLIHECSVILLFLFQMSVIYILSCPSSWVTRLLRHLFTPALVCRFLFISFLISLLLISPDPLCLFSISSLLEPCSLFSCPSWWGLRFCVPVFVFRFSVSVSPCSFAPPHSGVWPVTPRQFFVMALVFPLFFP